MSNASMSAFESVLPTTVRVVALTVAMIGILLCRNAEAIPSFARQTDMPCAQCHTLSFGPALTEYGREFKLNGYTWGQGDSPMPIALMLQGGFSRSDAAQPAPPAPHYSTNNNISLDQVSLFYGGRITEHSGAFAQGTYSGSKRNTTWDNTDIRYARAVELGGTEAVVGVSLNNNPTVQDLWNSTPAWGFPYINSPLVPGATSAALIEGGLAQTVYGVTAYTMIHNHVYLEGGFYKNLSDRLLNNVGLGPNNNPHINGVAPYWRLTYQNSSKDKHYFSIGTFGLSARLQPDQTVPDQNRYTDIGFDATYQYTDGGRQSLTVNTSYIRENQNLIAIYNAGGADHAGNHLNTFRIDASYAYHQTWSAGAGFFDINGATDLTLYAPGALTGSNNGSPDTRGYVLQFECVPLGKMASWGRPWVNVRVGLQYTGYLKFNGGNSNYDGFGRSATQNNSLFVFSWMAF